LAVLSGVEKRYWRLSERSGGDEGFDDREKS